MYNLIIASSPLLVFFVCNVIIVLIRLENSELSVEEFSLVQNVKVEKEEEKYDVACEGSEESSKPSSDEELNCFEPLFVLVQNVKNELKEEILDDAYEGESSSSEESEKEQEELLDNLQEGYDTDDEKDGENDDYSDDSSDFDGEGYSDKEEDDDLNRRVEEFIRKINNGWRAESLRDKLYLFT
ncbi:Protein of unknown function DUF761 [Macleaya cordata]|uniref:Uncharacterized protein n=1 Tax=Macleaya cordata TaxID=56857 RepID=A0A200QB27_MACCD|nr:Protein of unknown function DUF761 [Macleaya cordata]